MKPPVTDWPEADNYVLEEDAQLVDKQGISDEFVADDPPRPIQHESLEKNSTAPAQAGGNGSYEGWMIPVEREVADDPRLSPGAFKTYVVLCGYQGRNCKEPYPGLETL